MGGEVFLTLSDPPLAPQPLHLGRILCLHLIPYSQNIAGLLACRWTPPRVPGRAAHCKERPASSSLTRAGSRCQHVATVRGAWHSSQCAFHAHLTSTTIRDARFMGEEETGTQRSQEASVGRELSWGRPGLPPSPWGVCSLPRALSSAAPPAWVTGRGSQPAMPAHSPRIRTPWLLGIPRAHDPRESCETEFCLTSNDYGVH